MGLFDFLFPMTTGIINSPKNINIGTRIYYKDNLEEKDIKQQLREDGALYGLIQEMQKNVLKVTEIDNIGNARNQLEFHTNSMSDTFYVGQKITA